MSELKQQFRKMRIDMRLSGIIISRTWL